jgi:ABC-type transporter Mla MlaB component
VVIPLFGRKTQPKKPEAKPASKPVADKTPTRRLPQARTEAPDDSADQSLDFSAYVPPSRPESPIAREPAPALDTPTVAPQSPDAWGSAALKAPDSATPPVARPAAPSEPPSVPGANPRSGRPPDSIMSIEVSAAANGPAAVIEETAILFANGQAQHALAVLSKAVQQDDLGDAAQQCWLMLFDLYQHLGRRIEFEAQALQFVVKFERSPPMWLPDAAARPDVALATGGTGYCALTGNLDEGSGVELEKLRATAQRQHIVRLDCGKLQSLNSNGCTLLQAALLETRAAGKEVILSGETQLFRLLEDACQPGKIETDGAIWSLLFEVYRMCGLQDKFEEAAVNYAITFEVSPPSWEKPREERARPVVRAARAEPVAQGLVLSGEVTAAGEALARQMQEWAKANGTLTVDLAKVRRVDFVSAGMMLNVLTKLSHAGVSIRIQNANELVAALFAVMGIEKVATVVRRK